MHVAWYNYNAFDEGNILVKRKILSLYIYQKYLQNKTLKDI